jgi:hypothetical protein
MLDGIKLTGLFALHVLLGIAFFLILAAGAFFVGRFTDYVAGLGAHVEVVYTCRATEDFLLFIDVICVVVFVIAQTRNYIVRVWKA